MADLELHDEVVKWMDTLDEDDWDRTVIVIDRLGALGNSARMPLSRSLGDGVFELRFSLGQTARRITYPVHEGRAGRAAHHVPQTTQQ